MKKTSSMTVLPRLSWSESDSVASHIAYRIRRGLRRFQRGVLEDVAAHFRVRLRWEGSGSLDSVYLPPLSEGDFAQIVLPADGSESLRWRAFIHELAHHLMHTWVAPALYSCERVCLLGNPDCAPLRHAIARRVEVLVVGPAKA
jgi:hypothetical protein